MKSKIKILIVEDDNIFSSLIKNSLSDKNFLIEIENNPENVIKWAKENQDSVILLDYRLQGINADQIILKLNKLKLRCNVVVMTAYSDTKVAVDMMKLGAKDFLIKDENILRILPEILERQIKDIEKEKKIKDAEKLKEDYEHIYQTFVQNFKGIAYRFDRELSTIFVSGDVESITGYSEEELKKSDLTLHKLIYADDYEKILDELEKIKYIVNYSTSLEYRIVTKDRKIKWVYDLVQNISDKGGNICYIQGAIYDITDRKNMEEELYREKERLSAVIKGMNEGLIVTDMTGRILMINRAAQDITGWSEEESVGDSISKVYRISSEGVREKGNYSLTEVEKEHERKLVTKNGDERIVLDTVSVFFDKDSKVAGVVIVFRDITEKKMLSEELQKANKFDALVTFASGLAHDFNNLLTIMMSNISLMLLNIKENDQSHSLLSEMNSAIKHAKDLAKRLSSYSRNSEIEKREINILDIISNSARFILKNSGVEFELDMPSVIPPIIADESEMYQLFNNIIINAKDAMPDGGVLRIKGDIIEIHDQKNIPLPNGNYFKIEISDTGCGIDQSLIDRIFDPYFTTKENGTGLGLAICYSIIKRHNGYITLQSEKDAGTTFYIYLPLSF